MIEKLLKAYLIEKRPSYGIILGFVFIIIGLIFSITIFRTSPSFPTVFFATLAAAPIVVKVIKSEHHEKNLLKRHEKIISAYFYLFFGMTIAITLINAFLPSEISNSIFSEQLKIFSTGYFSGQSNLFFEIILNNVMLVLFFFLLSLFYGAGSMFLLTWNASILGVVWGSMLKTSFSLMNPFIFLKNAFFIFPFLLPEIEAYFLASLAGGIISVNLEDKKKLEVATNDSMTFLLTSFVLIILAGIIEAFLIG